MRGNLFNTSIIATQGKKAKEKRWNYPGVAQHLCVQHQRKISLGMSSGDTGAAGYS